MFVVTTSVVILSKFVVTTSVVSYVRSNDFSRYLVKVRSNDFSRSLFSFVVTTSYQIRSSKVVFTLDARAGGLCPYSPRLSLRNATRTACGFLQTFDNRIRYQSLSSLHPSSPHLSIPHNHHRPLCSINPNPLTIVKTRSRISNIHHRRNSILTSHDRPVGELTTHLRNQPSSAG